MYFKRNLRFRYILIFLFAAFIAAVWLRSYIDSINMIRNGYINERSITFKLKGMISPFNETESQYILMQSQTLNSSLKHVWIRGNVKLPPIAYTETSPLLIKSAYAIIGRSVDKKDLPRGYPVAGYFDTSLSYLWDREIWLVSDKLDIDLDQGPFWVFTSSAENTKSKFRNFINRNDIEPVETTERGTYGLKSNAGISFVLVTMILFLLVLSSFVIYAWADDDKHLISILFISGYSRASIGSKLFMHKWMPLIVCLSVLPLIALVFDRNFYSLWNRSWVTITFCGFLYLLLNISVFGLWAIIRYSTRKRGLKYAY